MVREAKSGDIESILEIYNQAIEAGFQTGFTRKFTHEEMAAWFSRHDGTGFPVFVYAEDGHVLGWLSVSPYRQGRQALRYAVEISYFIHNAHQRKGIGSQLLEHALAECRSLGYKTVLAIILEVNTGSVKLLERYGFEQWAYLPAIADFDGVECGQVYYGLKVSQTSKGVGHIF